METFDLLKLKLFQLSFTLHLVFTSFKFIFKIFINYLSMRWYIYESRSHNILPFHYKFLKIFSRGSAVVTVRTVPKGTKSPF